MTLHDPFPGITGLPWWAVLLLAFFGGSLAVLIAIIIGAEREDGDLIPLNEAAEQRLREWLPQAIAALCGPCNGHPGTTCICRDKCANKLCAAADTTVTAYTADDVAWLRSLSIEGETRS